ncbi:hypothetical protein HK097_000734 [Rhizophlyctis rosea]|uniref:C2H2-type domain-containing protein n=1 Tax=Rhizophlyctis rosea TaxID=64517 RepID=A0AAD5SHS1_9FUNG|nr:hypothetical protein HK097_000734 [Rhizophlyctis rosea]
MDMGAELLKPIGPLDREVQLTSPSQWITGYFPSTFEDILGVGDYNSSVWTPTVAQSGMEGKVFFGAGGGVVSPLGANFGAGLTGVGLDGALDVPALVISGSESEASPSLSFGRSPSPQHNDHLRLQHAQPQYQHQQPSADAWLGMGMDGGMKSEGIGMAPTYSMPSFASLSDIQSVEGGSGTSTPRWEWDGEEEIEESSLPASPMMHRKQSPFNPLRHSQSAPDLLFQTFHSHTNHSHDHAHDSSDTHSHSDTSSNYSPNSPPQSKSPSSKPTRSSPPQGPRIYRCWMEGCSKCYGTGAGLRYHLRNFHKLTHIPRQPPIRIARIKPDFYECLKCGKRYGTAAGLRYHKKTFVHPGAQ